MNSTSTWYVIRPWGNAFSVWNEQEHGWATEGPISEAEAHEAIDRLTADAEWRRSMSDLDLQVEHGRQTLPAGHCSDEQQHDPHLMRAVNTVATHYCDGAALSYRGGLSEHYIRLFCRNVVADNDAYMAEEISHDEYWARVHERDAQVAELSADDRFYLNMLSAKDVAAGGQLPFAGIE